MTHALVFAAPRSRWARAAPLLFLLQAMLLAAPHAADAAQWEAVRFRPEGARIRFDDGSEATFVLRAWGQGGTRTALTGGAPRRTPQGVEYDYGDVAAWYRDAPDGVEQGFTLTAPPPGTGDVVTLEIEVRGDLVPRARDARLVELVRRDGRVAGRYGGLEARDATGNTLPAQLRVSAIGRAPALTITVAAADARYPIVIDPFATSVAEAHATDGGRDARTDLPMPPAAEASDRNAAPPN